MADGATQRASVLVKLKKGGLGGAERKEGQALRKHPVDVFSAGARWRVGVAVFSE